MKAAGRAFRSPSGEGKDERIVKKWILALAVALLMLSTAAAEGLQLPDVGVRLGVEGELYGTSQEKSGPYHTYLYEVEMTLDGAADVIVDYTEAARETGFTPQSNAVEGALIKYMSFSDETGMADLALYVVDGAKELASGGAGTLWFALAVPDSMAFELGDGGPFLVEGGTRCVECGGSGTCAYCGGLGSCDYGAGYETCVVCDGSGLCNVCDGEGKY